MISATRSRPRLRRDKARAGAAPGPAPSTPPIARLFRLRCHRRYRDARTPWQRRRRSPSISIARPATTRAAPASRCFSHGDADPALDAGCRCWKIWALPSSTSEPIASSPRETQRPTHLAARHDAGACHAAARSTSQRWSARWRRRSMAIFAGTLESDRFNVLVTEAGLWPARGRYPARLCALSAPDRRALRPDLYRRCAGALSRGDAEPRAAVRPPIRPRPQREGE